MPASRAAGVCMPEVPVSCGDLARNDPGLLREVPGDPPAVLLESVDVGKDPAIDTLDDVAASGAGHEHVAMDVTTTERAPGDDVPPEAEYRGEWEERVGHRFGRHGSPPTTGVRRWWLRRRGRQGLLLNEQFGQRRPVVAGAHRGPTGPEDVVTVAPASRGSGPGAISIRAVGPVVIHPEVVGGEGVGNAPAQFDPQPLPAGPMGSALWSAPTCARSSYAAFWVSRRSPEQSVPQLVTTTSCSSRDRLEYRRAASWASAPRRLVRNRCS